MAIRLTQEVAEAVQGPVTPTSIRLTQEVVEAVQGPPAPTEVRLTQIVIETTFPYPHVFEIVSSGGLKFGGSGGLGKELTKGLLGGLKFSGSSSLSSIYDDASNGGLKLGGSTVLNVSLNVVSRGGILFNINHELEGNKYAQEWNFESIGNLLLSGSVIWEYIEGPKGIKRLEFLGYLRRYLNDISIQIRNSDPFTIKQKLYKPWYYSYLRRYLNDVSPQPPSGKQLDVPDSIYKQWYINYGQK